ncbi:hypothetical protein [Bernardetia sp.]|uniref:hypothetical protein n=1 Tax=Bernardetia sp. TaxID=1937974 RepID=UPI0025C5E75D|nr:hypothetical protein [Bernardetia sp.]
MSNSLKTPQKKIAVTKEKNGQDAPKTVPTITELQEQIKQLKKDHENERLEFIADLRGLEEEKESLQNDTEKAELENSILKSKILHHEQELQTAAKNAKEEAQKQVRLLEKQLQEAKKPSHKTAEEKINRLEQANKIKSKLDLKLAMYESFSKATEGSDMDTFRITFEKPMSNEKFTLGNSDIIKDLINTTKVYMENSIDSFKKQLLSYQI